MIRFGSIFFFIILLVSCGKDRRANSIISSIPNEAEFSDSSESRASDISKALEIQIPMSNEELKNWIPVKVGQMEQRKLIVGHKQGMEMSGAISTYQEIGQEGKQVSMEVLDGAGATAAVMLSSISQKLNLDYEEQLPSGYSKIYEREGLRIWEKSNSEEHHVEIEFVLKERFHFIFKGYQIQMDEFWAFVKEVIEEMK
ncbi:hypothetical protein [Algoriphagus aquimarinus]|uniref:Uncharacterized protein n=1 Tax=Algoriphagus aquimarinus TaxID=237018 RepID=A0A5C7ARU5_9BACT|nr:hypothetical protein [Algoriphagus aquimarinus]TXE11087.1 hypothetical protein ESV85_12735 [Algoriphagus aquimarinus]